MQVALNKMTDTGFTIWIASCKHVANPPKYPAYCQSGFSKWGFREICNFAFSFYDQSGFSDS